VTLKRLEGLLDFGPESSLVWCPGLNKRIASKELTALTPEIDCDQTAMGLPPVTTAVLLIKVTGIKRERYVCTIIFKVLK
jgi:hypothetical protein